MGRAERGKRDVPKRSREYMDAQRLRFCEAAMACFRRKGVVATNLNDICEEAGLSMGALYKHFASRDELLEAILALRLAGRNEALHGSSWPELRAAILAMREDNDRNPFWREFLAHANHNDAMRELRLQEGAALLAQIDAQVRRFAEAGEIDPPFPPRETAQLISVIFDGSTVDVRTATRLHVALETLAAYLDHAVGARAGFRA